MWASMYAVIYIITSLLIIVILCTTVASDGGPAPRTLVAFIVTLMSVEELQADSS